MTGCVLIGVLLLSSCTVHARVYATDRARCVSDPHRIKAPRPVRREGVR